MNLNDSPTLEQFRDLLRRHDDHAGHHVLWVREDGEVMITRLDKGGSRRQPPTFDAPDMRLRYGTFPVGYEYVGEEAAEDRWWTSELFANMVRHWAKVKDVAGLTHIKLHTVAPDGCPVGYKD